MCFICRRHSSSVSRMWTSGLKESKKPCAAWTTKDVAIKIL